ncbi:hypothetical protein [Mucilaginibacter terrae]|uniref:Tetratricopeptide (TPR) repeat protein n=1 Tax=Mucilaginibacter terrae TaxID=1955052 RepID=A0ABU3GN74_9SPHI|nr:hypothetical protein [Mucilaginibacter terrae]MDT3400941.1 tetratricopeptide (TPR) repeat protein [Mucilaginibacter terrae]
MNLKIFITIVAVLKCFCAVAQTHPQEFFDGLNNLTKDEPLAKKQLLIAASKEPDFYGTYHFLGVISQNNNQLDSAIYYYKKSVDLNTENVNHTREMAYSRLIIALLYKHDIKNAFDAAWEACKAYPESKGLEKNLGDVCLWAYYTKHNGLNLDYLAPAIKVEYVVNSIPEEYLIVRYLKLNNEPLNVAGQSLVHKGSGSYDVLKCVTASKAEATVNCKINWDMGKEFGGKTGPVAKVLADKSLPVYERAGAVLVNNAKADIKKEVQSMLN